MNMSEDIDLYADNIEDEFNQDGDNVDLYDDVITASSSTSRQNSETVDRSPTKVAPPTGVAPGYLGKKTPLIVGNLTWWTTDQDLTDAITGLGINDLMEIKFYENRANGQSKGFAIVTVQSDSSGRSIIDKLPKKDLHGNMPVVTHCNKSNLQHFQQQAGDDKREVGGSSNTGTRNEMMGDTSRDRRDSQGPSRPRPGSGAGVGMAGPPPMRPPMGGPMGGMMKSGGPPMMGPRGPMGGGPPMGPGGMMHRMSGPPPGGPRLDLPPMMAALGGPPPRMGMGMGGPPMRGPPPPMSLGSGPAGELAAVLNQLAAVTSLPGMGPPGLPGSMPPPGARPPGPIPRSMAGMLPRSMAGMPPRMVAGLTPRPMLGLPPRPMNALSSRPMSSVSTLLPGGLPTGLPPLGQPPAMQPNNPTPHVNPAFFPPGQGPPTSAPPSIPGVPSPQQPPLAQVGKSGPPLDPYGRSSSNSTSNYPSAGGDSYSRSSERDRDRNRDRERERERDRSPVSRSRARESPVMSDADFEDALARNKTISSSAISRAVQDASAGEFASAIETLVTAVSLIKQSKIASDDRCKILISSLQDTLHGIEAKSYGSRSATARPNPSSSSLPAPSRTSSSRRSRSPREREEDHQSSRSREKRRRAERSRSRDRDYRERSHEDRDARYEEQSSSSRYADDRYSTSDRHRSDRDSRTEREVSSRSDRDRDRDRERDRDYSRSSRHDR